MMIIKINFEQCIFVEKPFMEAVQSPTLKLIETAFERNGFTLKR